MKIPKTFLQEKRSLEYTTERLLKEEPKLKTDAYKPAVEKSELENVLNSFDTSYSQTFSDEHLYSMIDGLIEKSDYKPVSSKRLRCKYWTRPSPHYSEESYVFIKSFDSDKEHYYSFAIVENKKLKEFCKRFEKDRLRQIGYPYCAFIPLVKGVLAGGALGFVADYAIAKLIGIDMSQTALGVSFLGVMAGFLYGAISIKYVYEINRKKLNKCSNCLITSSNKDAVKAAFS